MNYEETCKFLDKARVLGSILGMESINRLCERLGNPEDYGKVIHIAGTNGKGSTGAFIESALIENGMKVGRFTSPAVFFYEEMWKINGMPISKERLSSLMTTVKSACDEIERDGFPHPTVFEIETAAAYLLMKEEKVDISLIEVGCGGLTDATNVVKRPELSVITSISMDHMAFLGDTLEKIAEMKAGIIKENSKTVALLQDERVNTVLRKAAKDKNSLLSFADASGYKISANSDMTMKLSNGTDTYSLNMCGEFQKENFILAVECVKQILNTELLPENVVRAMEKTVWPGRFEKVYKNPLVVIDGCHNADAAVKLRKSIQMFLPDRKIHFIVGILKDKDFEEIVANVLPLGVDAICVTPPVERGLDKDVLLSVCKKHLENVTTAENMKEAVQGLVSKYKDTDDVIFIYGSLSYLSEAVNSLK